MNRITFLGTGGALPVGQELASCLSPTHPSEAQP